MKIFNALLPLVITVLAPLSASAAYFQTVLADNPVAYYRLGESSGPTMSDLSSNGNHGTYVDPGAALTFGVTGALAPADANTAVQFTANNSQGLNVQYGTVSSLFTPSATDWSLEFWVKRTADNSSVMSSLVSQQDGSGTGHSWAFFNAANGLSSFFNGAEQGWGGGTLALNQFYHVVLTFDNAADTIRWYKDGALSITTPVTMDSSSGAMFLGTDKFQAWTPGAVLDEVAFYTTRLGDARVAAHYDARFAEFVVPEPSTLLLLSAGGLLLWRTRRSISP